MNFTYLGIPVCVVCRGCRDSGRTGPSTGPGINGGGGGGGGSGGGGARRSLSPVMKKGNTRRRRSEGPRLPRGQVVVQHLRPEKRHGLGHTHGR